MTSIGMSVAFYSTITTQLVTEDASRLQLQDWEGKRHTEWEKKEERKANDEGNEKVCVCVCMCITGIACVQAFNDHI